MFVTVGRSSVVKAGELAAFESSGTRVAVANVDGMLYAIDDTCTHRQCSLSEGDLDGTTVTCVCHGSQFDVTSGAVLRGPATEPARSYAVRLEGDELQVEV